VEEIAEIAGIKAETINNKADLDLNNINPNASAKSTIVGWGMPDYSAGITIPSGYIANRKGLATVSMNGTAHVTNSIYINGIRIGYAAATNQYQESPVSVQIPLDVGDTITWVGTSEVTAMFFPFKGV
ncbi:MAG: hypothetical protein SOZ42_01270, partial [Candidatus Enterosoma sp.]|nr:hypothetical protein [Candidatus Enterosoma sp.]